MLQGQPRPRGNGKHKMPPMLSWLAFPMGAGRILETMQVLIIGLCFRRKGEEGTLRWHMSLLRGRSGKPGRQAGERTLPLWALEWDCRT